MMHAIHTPCVSWRAGWTLYNLSPAPFPARRLLSLLDTLRCHLVGAASAAPGKPTGELSLACLLLLPEQQRTAKDPEAAAAAAPAEDAKAATVEAAAATAEEAGAAAGIRAALAKLHSWLQKNHQSSLLLHSLG